MNMSRAPEGYPKSFQTPPSLSRNSNTSFVTPRRAATGYQAESKELPKIACDHVSILACCPITPGNGYEYFLSLVQPSNIYALLGTQAISPADKDGWKATADKVFKDVKLDLKPEGIVRLDRFYNGTDRMSSHAVFAVIVKSEMKHAISSVFVGKWFRSTEIVQLQETRGLLSPDILDIAINSCVTCVIGMQVVPATELTSENLFVGLDRNLGMGKQKRSGFEMVVHAAQFGRVEQELLYKEFMYYTAPYHTMGWTTFVASMKMLGWSENVLPDLFRAFDLQSKGGLSFRDYLYGLAAVEPVTQHGGAPAEIRCRYIFRYYDQNGDGKLGYEEFKNIIRDIRKSRGLPDDPDAVQQEAAKSARVFGEQSTESLALTDFLTGVGQLKFRGTSHLLRSPTSVSIYLKTRRGGDVAGVQFLSTKGTDTETISTSMNDEFKTVAQEIFEAYDLATHSVRVRKSGTVLDIHSLWDIEHSGLSGQSQNNKLLMGPAAVRIQSMDHFNQDSQPNEMLNGLKYFERSIPKDTKSAYGPKPAFDWGEVDRGSLAKCILTLCEEVRNIMSLETRLLEISAPCYILGDLHGNFPDLSNFEKAIWRLGPMLTPASFLFLGDYVDRGSMGVEVVSYLFAQKILAPSKFYLLRGNHEMREVQQMFTFFRECVLKFGEKVGRDVWEAVNSAFDCMPLAAVVDKKVFCVHGGIVPPWLGDGKLATVNAIPCPLPKPEEMSSLAWELMWSDPIHMELLTPEQKEKLVITNGFANNLRRGTAHCFTGEALESFLTKNGLSHVIRAHEVQQAGFQVQHGGKLLTVFSSSRYCGGSNEAACILADKNKLRTIRIDTT